MLPLPQCTAVHAVVTVITGLCCRVQFWLLFPATSLILITVTPQRRCMTFQMTPPPQVTNTKKHHRHLHRYVSLQMMVTIHIRY